MYKELLLKKNARSCIFLFLFFCFLHFTCLSWCCRLENLRWSRRALVCQKALGVAWTLRAPVQTMLAVGVQIFPLAQRLLDSNLCTWPLSYTRIWIILMIINYLQHLQTYDSHGHLVVLVYWKRLPFPPPNAEYTCHRAHHPEDEQNRVWLRHKGAATRSYCDAALKCSS